MPINFRFEGNRPLLRELTAERLNQLIIELQRAKPLPGRGITARQEAGGVRLDVLGSPSGGASGGGSSHPFKVVTKKINETWHWGVVPNSRAFLNIFPTESYVGGLLSSLDNGDPGWIPVFTSEEPDYIYLQYDATTEDEGAELGAMEVSIDTTGAGGSLQIGASVNEQGAFMEIDFTETPPRFIFARKIIARAEVSQDQDAPPTIVQGIISHQLLQDICYEGNAAKWWFDYSGGTLAE
jgi:hypothetical protein